LHTELLASDVAFTNDLHTEIEAVIWGERRWDPFPRTNVNEEPNRLVSNDVPDWPVRKGFHLVTGHQRKV